MQTLSSPRSLRLAATLTVLGVLAWARPAAAVTVNTQADSHDTNPGDGVCRGTTSDRKCSLRAALEELNAQLVGAGGGAGSISMPNGTYKLNLGQLPVSGGITVRGASRTGTIIDAQKRSRAFARVDGPTGQFTLRSLTVKNGFVQDEDGGAVLVISDGVERDFQAVDVVITSSQADDGGGIAQFGGDLTLTDATISNNTATVSLGGFGGGVLLVSGQATVETSTFSGNRAADGGGFDAESSTGFFKNSTISGNTALASGGGFRNMGSGQWEFFFCTIAQNHANTDGGSGDLVGGGGIFYGFGEIHMGQSILAANTDGRSSGDPQFRPDCAQSPFTMRIVMSFNDNVVGVPGNCAFRLASGGTPDDQIGTPAQPTNPRLKALASNGGRTKTMALDTGSPAIDRVRNGCVESRDQRGTTRPRDGDGNGSKICDVGAYEK